MEVRLGDIHVQPSLWRYFKISVSFTVWMMLLTRLFSWTNSMFSAFFKVLNDFHLLQLDVGIYEVSPLNSVCIFVLCWLLVDYRTSVRYVQIKMASCSVSNEGSVPFIPVWMLFSPSLSCFFLLSHESVCQNSPCCFSGNQTCFLGGVQMNRFVLVLF